MKKRKVVMIDCDGVIFDFRTSYYKLCGVDKNSIKSDDTWNVSDHVTKEQDRLAWNHIKKSRSFWATMGTLCSDQELRKMYLLDVYHDIYFVTSRPPEPNTKWQTEYAIKYYTGIPHPTVVMSKLKGQIALAIGAHYSIEDKLENAVNIKTIHPKVNSYLIDCPYNQSYTEERRDAWGGLIDIPRVKTVMEFIEKIKGPR